MLLGDFYSVVSISVVSVPYLLFYTVPYFEKYNTAM